MKILALNSSPRTGRNSKTELLLNCLVEGMRAAGAEVYAVNLRERTVETCIGCYFCWTKTPGQCVHKDDMTDELLPELLASDLVIYATPLYNRTMNATMSIFRERTLPLFQPFLENHDGKMVFQTRYKLPAAVWLSVCGQPEESEFDLLSSYINRTRHPATSIMAEIYRTSSEVITHPVFRKELSDILESTRQAGRELVRSKNISQETMERIKRPIMEPDMFSIAENLTWQACIANGLTNQEFIDKGLIPRPDTLENFMAISVRGLNIEALVDRKVILQFTFSGTVAGACYFTIENRTITAVAGVSDTYDVGIETPFELWMDIMTGKIDGREMFLQRKYHVEGDLDLMLQLFQGHQRP